MRVVVQRSLQAQCTVDGKITGKIEKGFVLLVGFTEGDNEETIAWMVRKILFLRVFDDENGVMNRNILDIQGEILSISQFTLYADTKKGNRPSYIRALNGEQANILYEKFNQLLSESVPVKTGIFGSDMQITFTNQGPVTILLER